MKNINKTFEGRVCVSLAEAAYAVLDWTSSTTRTMLCLGMYPLPYIEIGTRKVVVVDDLFEFIDLRPKIYGKEKRKPGRPTKKSQLALAAEKGGQ